MLSPLHDGCALVKLASIRPLAKRRAADAIRTEMDGGNTDVGAALLSGIGGSNKSDKEQTSDVIDALRLFSS